MLEISINEQLEVWSWVFGQHIELGRMITSPFRTDTHPSCVLKEYNGAIFFLDSKGSEGNGYTCYHGVANKLGRYKNGKLDIGYAMRYVQYNLTFGIKPILSLQPVLKGFKRSINTEGSTIGFYPNGGLQSPGWTKIDIEYWSKRGVSSKQLENEDRGGRVYSCAHYIINKNVFEAKQPCYAYTINDKVKIYQPFAPKELKWFSTVTQDDYWHTQRGKRKLLISKSNKDHLECENLFGDYDIISPMNEVTMPRNLSEILDCYDETVAIFDPDETGLRTLAGLRDFGIKTFVVDVDGCKDIDDVLVSDKILKLKEIK